MGSARKYLALALAACQQKQFEEAGVFLAQASNEDDAEEVAQALGSEGSEDSKGSEGSDGTVAPNMEALSSEPPVPEDEEVDWGDEAEGEDEDAVSESSGITRRRHTSMFQIGKIIAASMSASSDEEDSGDVINEVDPDFPGETLVPASFSSITIKGKA